MSPRQTENDELRGRFTVWITKTARNAQINYLHKESRQLKTIPLETTEVQLIASEQDALEQTVSVANSFEFMESRLADASGIAVDAQTHIGDAFRGGTFSGRDCGEAALHGTACI